MKKRVVVGMSGGVDSSVTALLLKEQGYEVIGVFMRNWDEVDESGHCTSEADFNDVVRVCEQLDIPYYAVDFSKEYWTNVFEEFLEQYKAGLTPNPDILCNREIKFKHFYEHAMKFGADYVATGHYCQLKEADGRMQLIKGADKGKDQTYFLYAINPQTLQNVLFPIGGIQKSEVRKLATKAMLATKEKKDSTGICFIGERRFDAFLAQYLKPQKGSFCTLDGAKVGTHQGVQFYTIGQRKGLGLGGQGEPWFVLGKNIDKNIVYVERGEHPSLFYSELEASQLNWVSSKKPDQFPFSCKAKIRYRQEDQECQILAIDCDEKGHERVKVIFPKPQRAITLGQSVVFYDGEVCLGGGIITRASKNLWEKEGHNLPF